MRVSSIKYLFSEQRALLCLLQQALWGVQPSLPTANWNLVETLAIQQGVLCLLYQGAKAYPNDIPIERIKTWRADMISAAMRNDEVNAVQNQVISWINKLDIRVAVLKGLSCSRFYPVPEVRALGDIDLLLDRENIAKVGEYLQRQGFELTQNEHHFHSGYHRGNVSVELHYAVTQFPDSRGGMKAKEISKRFLSGIQECTVNGSSFPALMDIHQALVLLLHMERHMIEEGIGLRQLCDWATFVHGISIEYWQKQVLPTLQECGMLTFAKVLTKTCVNYLGLDPKRVMWCENIDDSLAAEMISEIFRGGNMGVAEEEPMVNLFFDRSRLGKNNQSRIRGLLIRITQLAQEQYPCTQKVKILLPIFWVYIPVRYWVRSLVGLRDRKKVMQLWGAAERRQKLYKALKLYRIR